MAGACRRPACVRRIAGRRLPPLYTSARRCASTAPGRFAPPFPPNPNPILLRLLRLLSFPPTPNPNPTPRRRSGPPSYSPIPAGHAPARRVPRRCVARPCPVGRAVLCVTRPLGSYLARTSRAVSGWRCSSPDGRRSAFRSR